MLAALTETGSIETYGAYAHGISITNTGDGSGTDYVNVVADGWITTHGNDSSGIFVYDTTGNVTVGGSGDITTEGEASSGISIQNSEGKVEVSVTGGIETLEADSPGIYVGDTKGERFGHPR